MVNPEDFKSKIKEIISQDYKLEFLGDDFNTIIKNISEPKADNIYKWVDQIIKRNIQPITVGSKKKYKNWLVYGLLFFKKDLKIENTDYRVFFMKVKNSFYIEFHLGKHKYYDKLRKRLDLTKKNY